MLRKGKKRTFLDIRGEVLPGGEQGLLSVAFAPDYQQSGLLYVYYVSNAGDLAIEEYRRASASADRSSARRVLTINHPGESNHNGASSSSAPTASSTSARATAGRRRPGRFRPGNLEPAGQDPPRRPRPSAATPSSPGSNPFVGDPGRDEIYALGLRNPFRFSFDRVSPKGPHIVIGDVGQDRFEEIDYETVAGARGANFGWNDFEGNSAFSGANRPRPRATIARSRSTASAACALIGGYVVASKKLKSVRGRYLYGDFCLGKLRSLVPELSGAKKDRALGVRVPSLSSFGLGPGAASTPPRSTARSSSSWASARGASPAANLPRSPVVGAGRPRHANHLHRRQIETTPPPCWRR